jgi:hypothetical protein
VCNNPEAEEEKPILKSSSLNFTAHHFRVVESVYTYVPLRYRVARFFLTQYTKTGIIYVQNYNKICQMTIIYYKWALNIPTFSIQRSSKFYPNWGFGF